MRLLNVKTFELEEFHADIPPYATLSHQWGSISEEVRFESLQAAAPEIHSFVQNGIATDQVNGISKIAGCCRQAKKDKVAYVWVDTCCIDKKSSTELSEAINSMFNWYAESKVCFAYLVDVTSTPDSSNFHDQVQRSRWFTRGWTLQELLAPSEVIFCNRDWITIGNKRDLKKDIQIATNIAADYLEDFRKASVATKMSWASMRQTSRVEDRAYSLFGIFGVSMYLEYGERDKAFQRLQLLLVEKAGDESIFAWTSQQDFSGLLAPSPECFQHSADIISNYKGNRPRKPSRVVQNTLQFYVPKPWLKQDAMAIALYNKFKKNLGVTMNCWRLTSSGMQAIKIVFRKNNGNWQRVNCRKLDLASKVPRNKLMGVEDNTVAFSLEL
ncbi:MAG: hypothetical protein Q9166_007085 [cf. Caloplaca sp. 2 TL-2023]